jgi:hypothetical protein
LIALATAGKGSSVCPKEEPMSFKSREKKRQARLAQSNGRREQRASYADRHYLTIVSRAACCIGAAARFAMVPSAFIAIGRSRSSA